MRDTSPELSVIIPVFNESGNLRILWDELAEVLAALDRPGEALFVDDASTDGSADVVRQLMEKDPRVRLVRLVEHRGLTAAFLAGFREARGRLIVTMDGDLQHDPADIPRLLERLGNADAVIGWRRDRPDPLLRRLSSWVGNAVRNALTGDYVHDSACSFRVMRRECAGAIPPYGGMHRFVPTLLRLAGYRLPGRAASGSRSTECATGPGGRSRTSSPSAG